MMPETLHFERRVDRFRVWVDGTLIGCVLIPPGTRRWEAIPQGGEPLTRRDGGMRVTRTFGSRDEAGEALNEECGRRRKA